MSVISHCPNQPRHCLPDFSATWIESVETGTNLFTTWDVEGEMLTFCIGTFPQTLSHTQAFLRHREGVLDRIHFQLRRQRASYN